MDYLKISFLQSTLFFLRSTLNSRPAWPWGTVGGAAPTSTRRTAYASWRWHGSFRPGGGVTINNLNLINFEYCRLNL